VVMPLADHDKREADYRAELERLHQQISALQTEAIGDQLVVLQAEKAEIETRLSDVTTALAARDQLITSLEADLTRAANEYPEVAAKAKAALDGGDFDAADSLFAQMEDAGDLAVLATARHAFSRGEIAEERIRWADAARLYGKAAGLDGSFANLHKAREFSWRNGDYAVALEFGPKLITAAIAEFGENTQEHALALNEHALSVHAAGRFSEAEGLYRQALDIDRATIGETHPNYATALTTSRGWFRRRGGMTRPRGFTGRRWTLTAQRLAKRIRTMPPTLTTSREWLRRRANLRRRSLCISRPSELLTPRLGRIIRRRSQSKPTMRRCKPSGVKAFCVYSEAFCDANACASAKAFSHRKMPRDSHKTQIALGHLLRMTLAKASNPSALPAMMSPVSIRFSPGVSASTKPPASFTSRMPAAMSQGFRRRSQKPS
jgi:tetratricopeptide (TPR) repeat protein